MVGTELLVLGAICVSTLIVGAVVCARLIDAFNVSTETSREMALDAMREMQSANAKVMHKMESWHECDKATTISHMERILEYATAPLESKVAVAGSNGLQRTEERIATASHSTNERMADLHEAVSKDTLRAATEQEVAELNKKVPVPISKRVKDGAAAAEGRIPQRHGA